MRISTACWLRNIYKLRMGRDFREKLFVEVRRRHIPAK